MIDALGKVRFEALDGAPRLSRLDPCLGAAKAHKMRDLATGRAFVLIAQDIGPRLHHALFATRKRTKRLIMPIVDECFWQWALQAPRFGEHEPRLKDAIRCVAFCCPSPNAGTMRPSFCTKRSIAHSIPIAPYATQAVGGLR